MLGLSSLRVFPTMVTRPKKRVTPKKVKSQFHVKRHFPKFESIMSTLFPKSKNGHSSQNGIFADSFLAGKRITDK
jgi:hypothetical protein